MAGETWETIDEDLGNVRVRVSAFVNLNSLEKRCLVTVADTIDYHCKSPEGSIESLAALHQEYKESIFNLESNMPQYFDVFCHLKQEPFKDLPPIVLRSLQHVLEKRGSARKPHITMCFINENTEKLVVSNRSGSWSERDLDALVTRIKEKGKNISELKIHFGKPCLERLTEILQSLQKLTSLELEDSWVDDSVMAVVAANCPQLRKLVITVGNITEDGFNYLWMEDGIHGKCKKLRYLDVGRSFVLRKDNITKLPELVYLNSSDLDRLPSKKSWRENNTKLKLQYLQFESMDDEAMEDASNISSNIPDVKRLEILSHECQNIDEFLKFKHVTEIIIINNDELEPLKLLTLVTNFSNQLTKLKMSSYLDIDISVIGFHCLHLTDLEWEAESNEDMKYELVPFIHFSKLKIVALESFAFNPEEGDIITCAVPDLAMKCILGSHNLEELKIDDCDISDEVLGWLIDEARSHQMVFSQLKELELRFEISTLRLKQIFCMAPKLQRFTSEVNVIREIRQFLWPNGLTHCRFISSQ